MKLNFTTMLPKKLHVFWYRKLFLDIRSETSLKRILWIGSFLMILNVVLVIGLVILALILYQFNSVDGLSTNEFIYTAISFVSALLLIAPLFLIFVPGMRALFYERIRRDKIKIEEAMKKETKSRK